MIVLAKLCALLLLLLAVNVRGVHNQKNELVVVTVATDVTDGFVRFNRSVNVYGFKLEILGLNQQWTGGDVTRLPGGGQKVNLLKKYLQNFRDRDDMIILFTDSYDVILSEKPAEVVQRFQSFNSSVVFSSEKFCWPDKSLAKEYPSSDGKRYLNSGAFIGYASSIYSIITNKDIEDDDDDQLYYTKIYLDPKLRDSIGIKLDLSSFLFQNLNGALNEVEIRFIEAAVVDKTNADAYLYNKVSATKPIVIHGNGDSKVPLNSLGNYLAKSWHPATGCLACGETSLNLDNIKPANYPYVMISINIFKPTPFFVEFLEDISLLNYPKDKITLFIQTSVGDHAKQLEEFIDNFKTYYKSIVYHSGLKKAEWILRNHYLDECVQLGCDYIFVVDTEARLTNADTLLTLIEANKPVVAPVLIRHKQFWSNFWGALTHDGFYSRSHDYLQIVQNERRGIWNVPYIGQSYLIKASLLGGGNVLYSRHPINYGHQEGDDDSTTTTDHLDADMHFCRQLRGNGIFMYADNMATYGHLANLETYDGGRKHGDFYEIEANYLDWRRRYIHENYSQLLAKSAEDFEQPCPDVYWFPLVSPIYCKHLIEIMENHGQWSEGKNYDPRLDGGYENVPTRDIHMKQVDLEQQWLYFLREYVRPIQEKVFLGYHHDPPKAIMNFVVRYHPAEQAFLRPHHDASTFTINIALNERGVDYEGGGCRFIRYNCSLTNLRLGWSLIHPGRLTHYHEGLTVTKGVRYIMVSFVDP